MICYSGLADPFDRPSQYKRNDTFINGLDEYELNINEHIPLEESNIFNHVAIKDGNTTQLNFENLRPGSVAVVR